MNLPRLIAATLAVICFATSALGQSGYPEPAGRAFTNTYPYSMSGLLEFRSGGMYSGSATVIRPYSVLTAAHNLWDRSAGWSTSVDFSRAYHKGTYASKKRANRIYVLAGYQEAVASFGNTSTRAFAKDIGGAVFATTPAGGTVAPWKNNTTLLTGTAYNICLGYGGEFHSAEEMLSVEPSTAFYKTLGGFFQNNSFYVESGMSGGPVFARNPRGKLVVVAVLVSSVNPAGGFKSGVRAINNKAASFITTYLP